MHKKQWASHARNFPKKNRVLRVLLATLLFLVIFTSSAVAMVFLDVNSAASRLSVQSLLGDQRPQRETPTDQFSQKALNILVIGSDYRSDKEYDENGALISGMRSDTTLVVHVSADRKSLSIVSIPRDLMTKRPKCYLQNGKTIPESTKLTQFNLAFSTASAGKDIGAGVACTQRTVEAFSQLYIDEFVVVDFDGFRDMVQALGGVNMCLEAPMKDTYGTVDLPAGCQVLDGNQALGYARARHGVGDGSDISRISRQQKLIGSILKQAMSKNYITDAAALYGFLKSGLRSMTVSPEFGNITALAGLASSLQHISPSNIRFYTLPITAWPVNKNRVIAAPQAQELWEALRYDQTPPDIIEYRDMQGNIGKPAPSLEPDSKEKTGEESESDPNKNEEKNSVNNTVSKTSSPRTKTL